MTDAMKHDAGKPAWHMIPVEAEDLFLMDLIDVSSSPAPEWLDAWRGGTSDRLLASSFASVAALYGTRDPSATARLELARALAHGAGKYGDPNQWRAGLEWSRLWRAAYGHVESHLRGDLYDDESGLMHLSHALSAIMMLYVSQKLGIGTDDRATVWPRVASVDWRPMRDAPDGVSVTIEGGGDTFEGVVTSVGTYSDGTVCHLSPDARWRPKVATALTSEGRPMDEIVPGQKVRVRYGSAESVDDAFYDGHMVRRAHDRIGLFGTTRSWWKSARWWNLDDPDAPGLAE